MLMQILHGTPAWVFVLFAVLLALGLRQTRLRRLAPARVALLNRALKQPAGALWDAASGTFLARALRVWAQRAAPSAHTVLSS